MDKLPMTFSFQKPNKKHEYLSNDLNQLQDITRQARSKSTSDFQSVTTNDTQTKNYFTIVHEDVTPFNKLDPFKALYRTQNESCQTDGEQHKFDSLQLQVNALQSQKEDILHLAKTIKKENQTLMQTNKALETENQQLKSKCQDLLQHLEEWPEKEKYYQQTLQQQNWQILKINTELSQVIQAPQSGISIINQFTQSEQEYINKQLKDILNIQNKQMRQEAIFSIGEASELKEEIIQIKKAHFDKLKELMEKIKYLQTDSSSIEPELLSTQESIALVTNVLHRAVKSHELLTIIRQNQRLCLIIDDLANKLRFKLDQTQQHVRAFSQQKDLNSTNKKHRY